MYQLINRCDFHDAFRNMGRLENFSYEGRNALYDFIIEGEGDELGNELDVISLCCEFNEDDVYSVLENYGLESIDELEENTLVIWHDQPNARVLYQAY